MRITLCTHKFVPPFVGGVDVYTDKLGRALERLGHEVMIVAVDSTATMSGTEIIVSQDDHNGSKIWRVKFSLAQRPPDAFDFAYDPEVGMIIKRILKEQKPDVFIIMNFYTITLAVVEAAKELGITVAHVATDFLPICRRGTFMRWDNNSCQTGESIKSCASCFVSGRVLGRLASAMLNKLPEETLVRSANNYETRKILKPLSLFRPYWKQVAIMAQRLKIIQPLRHRIDVVLAANQFIMRSYLANGFRPDQVHFLPFGVETDHPLANLKHAPASHTRFLFVGRFQPYKGAHLLLKAFNNLESPQGSTLTVYGVPDNNYDTYFNQLKAMMATNEGIRFAGKIAPTELSSAFAEADFFVLPSTWHENSPLILLDALQSKTPVIASNIGGVTDVVKDEITGLLFPMGDEQALQQVMQRVIDQPVLGEQLKSGINLPSIDDYAQTVIELCQN